MSGTAEDHAALGDFSFLTPPLIAEAVEAVIGAPVDGTLISYPSYVNRVYGLATAEGARFIAKFYRPGRWTEAAIRDEHLFTAECAAAGLPVPCPLPDADGETLSATIVEDETDGEHVFLFALYPHIPGRCWEAERDEDWIKLGLLIASVHEVGRKRAASERTAIDPDTSTRAALVRLLRAGVVHPDIASEFEDVTVAALEFIAPLFRDLPVHRLHGDLHRGNLLTRSGGDSIGPGFDDMALIDFDDMAIGPAVQDLWLFLPGRLSESRRELSLMLEGYGERASFDRTQIGLIEPLRFMRMIGYLDWQSRQRGDAGFYRAFPDWGKRSFWIKEVEDLKDQARIVREELD